MEKEFIQTEEDAEKAAMNAVKKQVEFSDKAGKKVYEKRIIDLAVKNDDDFLSPFSSVGKPVISQEVADFLENSASGSHPKAEIDLNIYGDCISDSERPVYEEAIKNYYSLRFTEAARTVTRKGFISLIFTIIGVITLSLMFVLSELGAGAVWTECVDIFAWVFLWEAVDQFFIERNGVLLKMKRYYAFMNSRITFISSPEE